MTSLQRTRVEGIPNVLSIFLMFLDAFIMRFIFTICVISWRTGVVSMCFQLAPIMLSNLVFTCWLHRRVVLHVK